MKVDLRKASMEDVKLLFDWGNEKKVRENSFSTSPFTFETHLEWLRDKLESDNCSIYIAWGGGLPVGQARVDLDCENALIGCSVDSKYRGMGYGSAILLALEQVLKEEYPQIKKMVAKIKSENEASFHMFAKSGFKECFITMKKELSDESEGASEKAR